MSLFAASLSSGSNGNCYYIGDSENAVLIDAGISAREIEKRLRRLHLRIENIKGIFVSHEHGDHIHGVPGFSSRHKIPVYMTPKTYQASGIKISDELVRSFEQYQPINLATISVTSFPKFHDAIDPHSFVIQNSNTSVGVFTDIGRICAHVIHNFRKCHAVFLETNYDEIMLENGPYSEALKRRIRGGYGHLSNLQAWQLFESNKSTHLTHLFLSHLSRNNNLPALVETRFAPASETTEIIVASRRRETKLVEVAGSATPAPVKPLEVYTQLKLF